MADSLEPGMRVMDKRFKENGTVTAVNGAEITVKWDTGGEGVVSIVKLEQLKPLGDEVTAEEWLTPKEVIELNKMDLPTGWKFIGEYEGSLFWETIKKSKIWKGQPEHMVSVKPYTFDKSNWTASHGQAPMSEKEFVKKEDAINEAIQLMKTARL